MTTTERIVNQNWWFTTLMVKGHKYCPPLTKDIKCDVLIVGGGFSGVSAAAEFLRKGLSVVLIEKNIIGGSSSGRSAGFLTPDSELELHQLVRRYGTKAAGGNLASACAAASSASSAPSRSTTSNADCCGRIRCSSGSARAARRRLTSELECRESVGFTDQRTYDAESAEGRSSARRSTPPGIRYGGTYGVNPLLCLQGLKDLLIDNGMQVFESTEMERLEDHTAYTHAGSVTADHIIIAVDKLSPSISPLADEAFHAQTFLSVTEPLTDRELRILFPSGEQMQCWDSKLVYSYFRLTGDNRLLLGGGTPITTFLKDAYNNPRRHQEGHQGLPESFPGVERSVLHAVLAGADRHDPRPAAGHREAARASARALHPRLRGNSVGDFLRQFRGEECPRRGGRGLQEVLQLLLEPASLRAAERPRQGDRQTAALSLSNSWAKFYQVDTLRRFEETEKEF